jgi:ribosomal-protein-alanine N-acetyltransferase
MPIRIRPAKGRDIDRILEIEAASFGHDAWERELFLEALEECSDLFLVAKLRRKIVGYAITCIDRDKAELVSIGVLPKSRRQGLGEALLRYTGRELLRRRIGVWRLMVRIENEEAIRFYRGLGFRRVRTVKDYYGKGQDAWRMECRNCVAPTHPQPESPQRSVKVRS